MSEIIENTLTAYLGAEFQQSLMWQILVEPEFAEKIIPDLSVDYFDDPNVKRLFIIIQEYNKEFEKPPNLLNRSIQHAINKYKTPNNVIEEESLFAIIERIQLWNDRILNNKIPHNGSAIQKETTGFVKQQEYRKLGEFILNKTRTGEIRQKEILGTIEEKINKISRIGDTEDMGSEVIEGIEHALRKEFRETIPTGVIVIDELTGGGLGKGEIGLILTPSGVGKTTMLTKVANTGYEIGKNVLQIIFEDTEDQIKRKHYGIWSKIPLSEIDDRREEVAERVYGKIKTIDGGKLIIKKFSQENTTMIDIRNWIIRYEKKHGYKFDLIVLDYLDCLESHKKVVDRNEAELIIVKSFLALAADFDVPCWSALQSNRSGFGSELIAVNQTGGNVKRIQKAHFFMSIAKPPDMKEADLANVAILKARFAKDGQVFKSSIFNNDTLEITLNDEEYGFRYSRGIPKVTQKRLDDFNELKPNPLFDDMAGKFAEMSKKSVQSDIHVAISQSPVMPIPQLSELRKDLPTSSQNDGINEGVNDGVNERIEMPLLRNIVALSSDAMDDTVCDVINGGTSEGANEGIKLPIKFLPITNNMEVLDTNTNISDVENALIDPDELENNDNEMKKTLNKLADNQRVIKKD